MLVIETTLTSPELTEAIAKYEALNGKVEDTIADFVLALINFTHEALAVPELFIGEDDRAGVIFELIGEDSIPNYLQDRYDDVCDRIHVIEGCDEIWMLIEAIVRVVVEADDALLITGKLKVN